MRRNISIGLAACAAVACSQQGKLAISAIPTALSQGQHPVSFRVAEAAAQFALGNVALAFESYRRALREEPTSVEAMIGTAKCYDAMGRYDLSRSYYEAALAQAPKDSRLLGLLSSSLLQQGRSEEAAAVKAELLPVSTAMNSSIGVPLLPPVARPSSAVTIELPVARQSSEVTIALVPARPTGPAAFGARLERLSLGEVALITRPAPQLAKTPAIRAVASVQFSHQPLLLLNAARAEGLAAKTRRYLVSRGLGPAVLGNASAVRNHSVVVAPFSERARARRLADALAISPHVILGRRLTLVLGKDAKSAPGVGA